MHGYERFSLTRDGRARSFDSTNMYLIPGRLWILTPIGCQPRRRSTPILAKKQTRKTRLENT